MKDITDKNFGVVIAFWLPGFILLWGLSYSFAEIGFWLPRADAGKDPTVGGFLYVTVASLALGLLASALRWFIIDHLHRWTGLNDDGIDFGKLKEKERYAAFLGVVENHYSYYQYYANTLVSIGAALAIYCVHVGLGLPATVWLSCIALMVILFCASRDSLSKYYNRVREIQK